MHVTIWGPKMIDGLIKTRDPSHPPFFASMAKKWKLQAMLVNKAFFSYLNAASLISDPPTGLSHPIFYPKPIRHLAKNSLRGPFSTQLNYQMSSKTLEASCKVVKARANIQWINWLGRVYSQWKIHLLAWGNKFSHVEKRTPSATLMDEPQGIRKQVGQYQEQEIENVKNINLFS